MNREELIGKLQAFQKNCSEKNYIAGDIYLNEAYPGIIPTSFVVSMVEKRQWLESMSCKSKALDKLIDVLWETTEPKTRESVFTLSINSVDEMVNSERKRDRKQVVTHPDLTSEQIKKLYYDKKMSVRYAMSNHIQTGNLTEQQISNLVETGDDQIISLLVKRYNESDDFKSHILSFPELKTKFLGLLL